MRASARRDALPHLGTRVLVVDDNVDSAGSLATMFELLGCRTAMAHDGLAAVREAETFAPDLAVLDIGLPRHQRPRGGATHPRSYRRAGRCCWWR